MINFGDYKLIDFANSYHHEVIEFIDKGYKFLGYSSPELDSLDNDLLKIQQVYKYPSCFKLLLDETGKIIATVAVKIYSDKKEAELKRVFVEEALHGKGLGKKLSLWAFDYAKNHDCELMHIWSGTLCHTAHALYEKLGAKNMQTKRFTGGQDDCYEYYFIKNLFLS